MNVPATRRPLGFLVAVMASLVLAGHPVLADDATYESTNNVVQVNNQNDGNLKTRAKASVAHGPGPAVTDENVAVARASCVDCRTVAAAVQVILIEGPVTDFAPANAAVALNADCTRCQTFAYARQEVLQADRVVEVSGSDQYQIAAIRDQMSAVAASDAPFDEIGASLDDLTEQLVAVLQGAIANAGTSATRESHRKIDKHED